MPRRRRCDYPAGMAPAATRPASSQARHPISDPVRGRSERRVVTALVSGFVGLAALLAAATVEQRLSAGRARAEVEGTFRVVDASQRRHRQLHQRFATWGELEAEGVRLPPRQRVLRSNATHSHWYLALVDLDRGLVCDRVGDLTEETARTPVPPRCRPVAESL